MSARLIEVHGALVPLFAAPGAPSAVPAPPPPPVQAWHPGDRALLELHAVLEGEGTVKWPGKAELDAAFSGKAAALDEGRDGGAHAADVPGLAPGSARELVRTYEVQLLLPPGDGEIELGKLKLEAAGGEELDSVDVPPVAVSIESVLDAETATRLTEAAADPAQLKEQALQALAPPRGPWDLEGPGYGLYFALAAALVLLAVAAASWWRRRGKPKKAEPLAPPEPAEIVARRRLAALRAAGHLERGEHRAFHVEVSDILKTYLDARYGWDLVDRTSDETRRFLNVEQRKRHAVADVRADVLEILGACDLVKFAKHVPQHAESRALLDVVARVVDVTTPVHVPEAKQPEAAAS